MVTIGLRKLIKAIFGLEANLVEDVPGYIIPEFKLKRSNLCCISTLSIVTGHLPFIMI